MPPRGSKKNPVLSPPPLSQPVPSTPRRVRKPKKSPDVVDSDGDDHISDAPPPTPSPAKSKSKAAPKAAATKATKTKVPAVTMSKSKFRPKSPSPAISISSDGDEDGTNDPFIDNVAEEESQDDDSDVPLDRDDSMYKSVAAKSPNVRVGSKRSAPITPPLTTRGANTASNRSESPTKKSRVELSPELGDVQDDSEDAPYNSNEDDNYSTGRGVLSKSNVYHNDRDVYTIKTLPDICEVENPDNQDLYLKTNGLYDNLPKLKHVAFLAYRKSPAKGLVAFERWPQYIPNINMRAAEKAIAFVRSGSVVNLSRVDPREICAIKEPFIPGSNIVRYNIGVGGPGSYHTALCVGSISTVESYLHRAHPRISTLGHGITGRFHSEEFMRMISVLGMAVRVSTVEAVCWSDAMTFCTRQHREGAGSDPLSDTSADMLLNPASSPSKASRSLGSGDGDSIVPLLYGQTIPIYDVRNKKVVLNDETLTNPARKYRRIDQDLPAGCFVLMAFIANLTEMGKDNSKARMILYGQWGLLYGAPPGFL